MDKVTYGFDGSVFNISLDLNGNGKPLLKVAFDVAEIPGELFNLIFKKKAE